MPALDERLKAILASGRRPSITLFPGTEILIPKRRTGRPRVRDERLPFRHYRDPRAAKRRATCLAPTCRKRLRADQRGACSEACRDAVINEALMTFYLLGFSREELLQICGNSAEPQK